MGWGVREGKEIFGGICGCVGVSLKRGTLIGNGMALVCMEVVLSADPEEMPSFLGGHSHLP